MSLPKGKAKVKSQKAKGKERPRRATGLTREYEFSLRQQATEATKIWQEQAPAERMG
jgi:hypothetical protein